MDRKWKSRPENKKNHFMQIVLRTMKKPPSAEACLLGNGCQYYICTSQNDKNSCYFVTLLDFSRTRMEQIALTT